MKLNYGCTQLLSEDIALIKSPGWLNDKVVSFAMEYFGTEKSQFGARLPKALFVSAAVVQMVSVIMSPADLGAILADLKLESKETVFLPLNDHDDPMSRGGSHWALLVYHHGAWALFDSMPRPAMAARARVVAMRLSKGCGLEAPRNAIPAPPCAMQTNGHDCGVYVIEFAHAFASALAAADPKPAAGLVEVTPADVAKRRKWLLSTVLALCKES